MENEIYGSDANSTLKQVMHVSERPPAVAGLFEQFYTRLAEKQYDTAEQILQQIAAVRGDSDAELSGCRVKLKLERIRGGRI